MVWTIVAAAYLVGVLVLSVRRLVKRRPERVLSKGSDYLDGPVFVSEAGTWRRRDACQNAILLGATGSGKSSLLRWMLKRLLREGGSLLICAKSTDRAEYEAIARECGRGDDILVLDGTGPGLNFFGSVLTDKIDFEDRGLVAERAWDAVSAVINREARQSSGGENGFFIKAARQFVRFAVDLFSLADVEVSAANIIRLTRWVPATAEALGTEAWQKGFMNQCLKAAYANAEKMGRKAMFQEVCEYFTVSLASLSERTKSGVLSEISASGDVLARGTCQRLLSGGKLDVNKLIATNRIVIVDVAFMTHGDLGRACGAGIKYVYQQALLRRKVHADTPVHPIVCDEFAEIAVEDDAAYCAVCRSQRAPLIVAAQCLNSVIEKFGSKEKAEVLIANLAGRFICNPTPFVAKWVVENLIGKKRKVFFSGSAQAGAYQSPMDFVMPGPSQSSASFSQQVDDAIRPQQLYALATGGPPHFRVECLWFQAGRNLAGGQPYGFVTISQKEK